MNDSFSRTSKRRALEVDRLLRLAGWTPEHEYDVSAWMHRSVRLGFEPFPSAVSLVRDLGGIYFCCDEDGLPKYHYEPSRSWDPLRRPCDTFCFGERVFIDGEENQRLLAMRSRLDFCPVGVVGQVDVPDFIGVDVNGYHYFIGWAGDSTWTIRKAGDSRLELLSLLFHLDRRKNRHNAGEVCADQ